MNYVRSRVIQLIDAPTGDRSLRVARFEGNQRDGGKIKIHDVIALALVRYVIDDDEYAVEPVILSPQTNQIEVCRTRYSYTSCDDVVLAKEDTVEGMHWVEGEKESVGVIDLEGPSLCVEAISVTSDGSLSKEST